MRQRENSVEKDENTLSIEVNWITFSVKEKTLYTKMSIGPVIPGMNQKL